MNLVMPRSGNTSHLAHFDLVLVHSVDHNIGDAPWASRELGALSQIIAHVTGENEPSAVYLVLGNAIFQQLATGEWHLIGTGDETSGDRLAYAIELFRRSVGPRTCVIHDLRYKFSGDCDFPDRFLRACQFGDLSVVGTGVALAACDDDRLQAVTLPPVFVGEAAPVMGLSVSASAKEVDLGSFVVRPTVGWLILNGSFWQAFDSMRFSEWRHVNALELMAKAGTLCEVPHYGRQFDCASELGRLLFQIEIAFGNEKLRSGIVDYLSGYQVPTKSERRAVFVLQGSD